MQPEQKVLDLGNQFDRNLKQSKVSVIILNWNKYEETIECLDSLRNITYTNYGIVLVDNGSKGSDVKILGERYGNYINIIRNDRNYGFAEGCNIGMRYALENSAPDYILLINNDTIVAPDFLDQMVKVAEADQSIGIVGPKVYYYHDPNRIQSAGGRMNWLTGQESFIGFMEIDRGQFDELGDVEWVSGCAFLIRKKYIDKVGLLHATYFSYFEDIDWCVRFTKAGYRVVCVPIAKIWHKNLIGVEKIDSVAFYYSTRNRFLFMKRNSTKPQFAAFLIYFLLRKVLIPPVSFFLQQKNLQLILNYYKGICDGLPLALCRGS